MQRVHVVRWRGAGKRGIMTRDTLKRAIEIDDRIKKWSSAKADLEEMRKKCWGISPEVLERVFSIRVFDKGKWIVVNVSAKSAMAALDAEIEAVSKELEKLEKEFKELH